MPLGLVQFPQPPVGGCEKLAAAAGVVCHPEIHSLLGVGPELVVLRYCQVRHERRGGRQGVVDTQLLPILHESLDDVGDAAGSLCLLGGVDQDVDQPVRRLWGNCPRQPVIRLWWDCPQQPQGQGYDWKESELALGSDDLFPVP